MKSERIIYLKNGDFGEDTLVKISKRTIILFKLSPNLHGFQIKLFTNYSVNGFEREKYNQLTFSNDDFDEETFARLEIQIPGTFHFYYLVGSASTKPSGGGYLVVDPDLIIRNNEILGLDSISMITYLTKSLGDFKEWESRLRVAKETGYNFVHFTPVQSLGSSNSSYSILDQLDLNPIFGEVTWESLKTFIEYMQNDWGVLSLCDVVLNHTANETPWLKTNPEAAYNLSNCPHLIPPFLLDRLLVTLSDDISKNKLEHRGLPPSINSEKHLDNLRIVLHERIAELRLGEFYLVSVDAQINGLEEAEIQELPEDITVINSTKRFGSKVNKKAPIWKIEELNEKTTALIQSHLSAAVENLIAGVRYERIEAGGPKLAKVDKKNPLFHRYFQEINIDTDKDLQSADPEDIAQNPAMAPFVMAHNGWVMNDDPLRNFAEKDSNVYLRRELIAWGDSIKLRYGSCPADSPFLWNLMQRYVNLVSTTFHGLRLDNCHSTPLHVAEYLLDSARIVRPELFVVAELFTNSDAKDNVFVNHLGINTLIRECQQAWNSHEQGRLLFRFGGKPVGAFENTTPPAIANALLFDQTHDNPSAITKRSFLDLLPTAALVAFGNCALGSNRGYDDIVPHHIHVVNEKRLYTSFSSEKSLSNGQIGLNNGMLLARKSLNQLHHFLGKEGFSETFIDQLDKDVIAATRHNPTTRESIVLVSYTAFSPPSPEFKREPYSIRAIEIDSEISEIIFEGRLTSENIYEQDSTFLRGQESGLIWREGQESKFIKIERREGLSRIEFIDFQPGDVVAVKAVPFEAVKVIIKNLTQHFESDQLEILISKLTLIDLNHVLFRCKEEEGSVYSIPGWADPVYAGLQGIASILEEIARSNDLGHPLCSNLRQGNWLMDYIEARLISKDSTKELGIYIQTVFKNVGCLPRYLVPTYFEQVFRKLYNTCIEQVSKLTGVTLRGEFVRLLALTSVQFVGIAEGGALPAGGEEFTFLEHDYPFISYSMSAGLPHFSTGYMRSWGRDTFISLPGILLLTGRYTEAKHHILSYGSVMNNGLIPNLLNKGNCRYNCRDATWWWLYSIVKYIELVPNGVDILAERIRNEDNLPLKLEDIMHSTIQSHFEGISFRERNAGHRIDAHMKDEGFNIDVWVDTFTGFIHGGNAWNCGTWMDKMGSSDTARNKGTPATPRDGASVEIVGLSAAVLRSLWKMKEYSHKFVQRNGAPCWTYNEWYTAIKTNFESQFFISENSSDSLVNQRNIYKDTVGASNKFGDFQFRPNFLIAMTVAPELFEYKNAVLALQSAGNKLVSPLGVKTLDRSDWNYSGDYFNTDSSDFKTACGFNYHQGPEWLWPMGFYLRALLHHSPQTGPSEVKRILSKHYEYIKSSPWRSLPELTNEGGKTCPGSCTAQAWSCGTLLEVFHDLENLK